MCGDPGRDFAGMQGMGEGYKKKRQVGIEILLVSFSVIFLKILVRTVYGYPSATVTCQFFFSGELLVCLDVVFYTEGDFLLFLHIFHFCLWLSATKIVILWLLCAEIGKSFSVFLLFILFSDIVKQ